MKYTCISTSGSISAQGPQDQLPGIKLSASWDQMACNGSSNPSMQQERKKHLPISLCLNRRAAENEKTGPAFRDRETVLCLRRRVEGGRCYFCMARRWWWPVCVLVGKRKGEVKGKERDWCLTNQKSHRWKKTTHKQQHKQRPAKVIETGVKWYVMICVIMSHDL